MKNIFFLITMCFAAAACSNTQNTQNETTDTAIRPIDDTVQVEAETDTTESATDTVDYGKRDQETMRGILDGI